MGYMSGFKGWMVALATIAALCAPGLAEAKWLKAESPRFIVYSDGDERVLREQTAKLEAFDTLLRQFHNLPADGIPPRKLEVYLVDGQEALREIWPRAVGIGGFYSADSEAIHAVIVRARKEDRTLFHEYTHHFMLQFFPYPYPAWLVEGYAEYFGASDIVGGQIEVGRFDQGRVDNLIYLDWVPITDLLTKRPFQLRDAAASSTFYAQAWLLTHYFMSDPSRYKQMTAYMKAVGNGADSVKAMEAATGMPINALERKLQPYLRGGLRYGRYPLAKSSEITVTQLPASADDLLLLNLRVKEASEGSEDLTKKVEAMLARHPDDRLAVLTAARAEVRFGEPAKAEALLRPLLEKSPEDAEGLELLARAKIEGASDSKERPLQAYREAGKLFARSFKADPARYQALYGYARSRSIEASYPSDNDMEALLAAQELAPQASGITILAARASMLRKEWPRARSLLRPVANNPHGGDAAETAQKLLGQIDSVAPEASKP